MNVKTSANVFFYCVIILQAVLQLQVALGQEDLSPRVTELSERLTHGSNAADRSKAARALGKIGPEAAAVPALIEALKDRKAGVRQNAAWALGEIGLEAAPAVPALIEALKDREAGVREKAAWAAGGRRDRA